MIHEIQPEQKCDEENGGKSRPFPHNIYITWRHHKLLLQMLNRSKSLSAMGHFELAQGNGASFNF